MQIKENFPLAPYTTFYIGGNCRYLIFAQNLEEIQEAIEFSKQKSLPLFVFGGGSNTLVSDQGFSGVAVRIETVGIDIVSESETEIVLDVASGEVWDDVTRLAAEENWWGIENLSHIPGFTGAFAVQNVGAYGQEASQVLVEVRAVNRETGELVCFENQELGFGYRRSIFNTTHKDKYIIVSTRLKLQKNGSPNLTYGDLNERFQGQHPTITKVREAIIEIRNQKFPFPSEPTKGNAGSFFRGKVLSESEFDSLLERVSLGFGQEALQRLQNMSDRLKVAQGYKTPVAFLIELCAGKQLSVGGVSLNPVQPAIILNHSGQGKAVEILELFFKVKAMIHERLGVELEAEPEFIGFKEKEIEGTKFNK